MGRPAWDVDPAVLDDAAGTLSATGNQIDGARFDLARTTTRIVNHWAGEPPAFPASISERLASRDAWQGRGAQAFADRARLAAERVTDLAGLHRQTAQVLHRYAADLTQARQVQARADHYTAIAEAGMPHGARLAAGLRGADQATAAEAAQQAARASADAAELATGAHVRAAAQLWQLARQALRLAVGDDVDVARAAATGWLSVLALPGVPVPAVPRDRDPQRVARWWQQLTAEQRTALLTTSPALAGSLAGIPPAWRDWANRLALQQALLGPGAAPPSPSELAGYATRSGGWNLWHTLTTIAGNPRYLLRRQDVYLLGFDVEGPGRAVIALGDPATARHIGIVVPGTNNDLRNVQNPVQDAAALRATVPDVAGLTAFSETATVMWLGYETPTSFGGMDPRGYGGVVDAVDPGEARAGAPLLDGFVEELRAIHDPAERPHVSVFGHSYGSTVTGMAAAQGMDVDEVVLFGSPGAGADHASELDTPGHVWATRILDDPIRFGEGAAALGEDPVDEDFGAKRFAVDPPPVQSGHSDYYEMRTKGIKNFARIMTSQYDLTE